MLEIHRFTHVDWIPSPVVALATSVDGAVVAAARENGAIEVCIVAPGSVGWHCELVVDVERGKILHRFKVCIGEPWGHSSRVSPVTKMCSSGDDQWLATSNSLGEVTMFNLETFGAMCVIDFRKQVPQEAGTRSFISGFEGETSDPDARTVSNGDVGAQKGVSGLAENFCHSTIQGSSSFPGTCS